jgi:hypothetical protein
MLLVITVIVILLLFLLRAGINGGLRNGDIIKSVNQHVVVDGASFQSSITGIKVLHILLKLKKFPCSLVSKSLSPSSEKAKRFPFFW